MIRKEINKHAIKYAVDSGREFGRLRNSITNGQGNTAGLIGEMMVCSLLPGFNLKNTFDYDIEWNNLRIEVKTKRTSRTPEESYDCSVANYNDRQNCDVYVFCRVIEGCENVAIEDYSVGWVLGWVTPYEFHKLSTEHTHKETDPDNNFDFRADCKNIKISQLHDMEELR